MGKGKEVTDKMEIKTSKFAGLSLPLFAGVLGGLLLAFLLTLALVSNRPSAGAVGTGTVDTTINARAINPKVALYLDGQEGSRTYSMNIIPTSSGSISSIRSNVRVVTTDAVSYTLSLRSTGPDLVGTYSHLTPMAGGSATIESPTAFTSSSCNTWGFATPRDASQSTTSQFDTAYDVLQDAIPGVVNSGGPGGGSAGSGQGGASKYAAVPTSDTIIRQSGLSDETTPYYVAACVNDQNPSDTYTGTVVWTAVALTTLPEAQNGDYMQEVGKTLTCPTNRTWLVDARDNHTYWIQKIPGSGTPDASGNPTDLCWMETNLAYGGGTSNGGTDRYGDVMTLTDGDDTSPNYSTMRPFYYVPPQSGTNYTLSPTEPSRSVDGGATNPQYGYHYNWCGATGGQDDGQESCVSIDTSISVCPDGWRAPTGNPGGEFEALNRAINNGSSDTGTGLLNDWLIMYAGQYEASSRFDYVGYLGNYWSSTAVDGVPYDAYYMYSSEGSGADTSEVELKDYGMAVRCVQ